MKPQDLVFIIVVALLLFIRKPRYAVLLGSVCLVIAIPLFHFWVFFTAERLTMYAAGFYLVAIILFGFQNRK
jgi:hypothetical protein